MAENNEELGFVERQPGGVPLDEAVKRAIATIQGAGGMIPGYDALVSALAAPLSGVSVEESARNAARNVEEHPGASLLGLGAATAGTAGLGAAGAAAKSAAQGVKVLPRVKAAAKSIAQSAGVGSAYGVGNLAFEEMFSQDPLTTEKILQEVGISTLLGAALGTVGEIPSVLGSLARKYGVTTARRALHLDPSDTRTIAEAEGMAEEALKRGMLSSEGAEAASAAKKQLGAEMDRMVPRSAIPVEEVPRRSLLLDPKASAADVAASLQVPTKYNSKLADQLDALTAPLEKVELADGARRSLQETAQRLRSGDATWADVREIQKAYAAAARRTGDNPATLTAYNRASETLRNALEEVAPGLRGKAKEYAFLEATSEPAQKAAGAPLGVRLGATQVPLPVPNPAQRARAGFSAGEKLLEFDKQLDIAAEALFGGGIKAKAGAQKAATSVPKAAAFAVDEFNKVFGQVESYRNDPNGFNERLQQDLSALPPKARDAMQVKALTAVNFLDSVAPRNPHPPAPGALPWEPSDVEKHQFLETYRTVADPTHYYRNPTPQGAAAIKQVWPEIMNEMNMRVLKDVATKENLSQNAKNKIEQVTGMAMDASHNPQFGARMQLRHQQMKARQAEGQQGSARTQAAMRKQDKAAMTRSDRIRQMQGE